MATRGRDRIVHRATSGHGAGRDELPRRRRGARDGDAQPGRRRRGASRVRALLAGRRPVLGRDPPPLAEAHRRRMRALLVLIAVTAVWGVTFVQVKDAVALYPLFAFLALRFAIASLTLAAPGGRRLRSLGRAGWAAAVLAGSLLGGGDAPLPAPAVCASALAYLAQTWAQRHASATQTALAFTLEPVWTAFFGFTLAGDRLGPTAWFGCAVIMAGIVIAEPAAAGVLARLVRRTGVGSTEPQGTP